MEIKELQARAEKAKAMYRIGQITREEASEEITPYLEAFNAKSIEIAKKYTQKPKKISLLTYLRSR